MRCQTQAFLGLRAPTGYECYPKLSKMFATSQHAHFIGIGGIGMSGIAEILLNQKMKVSGSDLRRSPITDRLAQLGAVIYEGHEAAHVEGATVS